MKITQTAYLIPGGSTDKRTTLHKYVEAREVMIPGDYGGRAFELIYACTETGLQRPWGNVDYGDYLSEGN